MKHNALFSVIICAILFLHAGTAGAQGFKSGKQRNLLCSRYTFEEIKKVLLSKEQFHPFPKAIEREQWDSIPAVLRQNYIKKGESALSFNWPSITAADYLDYSRTGSRERFSLLYNERRQKLMDLVLAECMEIKGRFLEQVANGLWLICEETSWVPPFHIVYQKAGAGLADINDSFVDLSSSETGNLIAWTNYLLGDRLDAVSPRLKERMALEIKKRILVPCLERDDYWWMWTPGKEDWSHVINNWVPWICSNWLATELLAEDNNELRALSVYKIMQTLDRFINSYPDDGGCDEGPSYFEHAAGSLFESLELMSDASENKVDVFSNPLIQDMGRYIYRAYISGEYFINSGDASAKIKINPDLVLRYGLKIGDENLAGLGSLAAKWQAVFEKGINGSMTRQLSFLFNLKRTMAVQPREPLIKDVWLPDTKLMAARENENSTKGFYVSAMGSHNGKSHNHNDAGNFIIYYDGMPLIADAGLGTYTAKTFSDERYGIWTMQSAYHNLPTINGIMQKEGLEFAARDNKYFSTGNLAVYSVDIAGAYPKEADIKKWVRTIKLDRKNGTIEVKEDYTAGQALQELTLSLLTPCEIDGTVKDGLLLYTHGQDKKSAGVLLNYDAEKMTPEVETIVLDDKRLKGVWGEKLKRILFHVKRAGAQDSFHMVFSRSEIK